ncbi:hypothetical protein [Burkholderia diffusa]|uniref:hypothetical protein n=1 Tax=Burkholderia diffusa TaxID=488732 RepID=UPI001FC8420B|nr:hypothetical protein [Burkholderia diffusa]
MRSHPDLAQSTRTVDYVESRTFIRTRTSTMTQTLAALAMSSALICTANAADVTSATGTATPKQRYVSPGVANVADAATRRPERASPVARCSELAAGIDAVKHAPDRGHKVVRGIGPDGKPRNELRAYDKRADLEVEHRQLGCP